MILRGLKLGKLVNTFNLGHLRNFRFSSFSKRVDEDIEKAIKNVKMTLSTELNYEKDSYTPLGQKELDRFLKENQFVYEEHENCRDLKLIKITDDYLITVYFKAKEPLHEKDEMSMQLNNVVKNTDLKSKEDEDFDEEAEAIEAELNDDGFNLQIQILKRIKSEDGKIVTTSSGFFMLGSFADTSLKLYTLYSGDKADIMHKYLFEVNPQFSEEFIGPDFQHTDQSFQVDFMNFLLELGLTPQLYSLIEIISQDKDQRLYMKWLKEMNDFFI